MSLTIVNKQKRFLTCKGIHLNQAHSGYSKWKQRLWPGFPVTGVCAGLVWWRTGHNHSRHIGRVDSITFTHTKVGLTRHFDPEKHMCTHICKRMWGNTSFPLVRVQENHLHELSHTHTHRACMMRNTPFYTHGQQRSGGQACQWHSGRPVPLTCL